MRIMALDYGKSKVGIALTDPLGVISQPFVTLKVSSQKELIKRLKFIIRENNVGLVLIGHPVASSGEATIMSQEVTRFMKKLKKAIRVDVKLWDERYTSKYAEQILRDRGLKGKKFKLDQIAASILLDEYLKSQSMSVS
ncbi:MAG: Holliday junction resolvase RuvX [candidate division WOR-3 bacterium]|nr:MAG: Holliday junction resolvase RuvX [candidate division WOR-3 bacterium]